MTADTDTIRAAQLLVTQLGLSLDDLAWTPPPVMPSLADYLPRVREAQGPGACRTYATYWERILATYGHRGLDEITATDVEILMREVMAATVTRRNHQHGHYAGEHLIAAFRTIYAHAIADRLLPHHHNPPAHVAKPRRPPHGRRALRPAEIHAINTTAASTGNDAMLDSLILRIHTETACRRAAALRLQLNDIDPTWCLIRLHEKNHTIRWHPASPTLTAALLTHHTQRTTTPGGRLLRYQDGAPLTTRRYDHLWKRLGTHLPWVAAQGITTHWLRHTTLTWVERHYGYAIAHTYAGHHDRSDSATPTYLHADTHDLAVALSAMTGERHPLADQADATIPLEAIRELP